MCPGLGIQSPTELALPIFCVIDEDSMFKTTENEVAKDTEDTHEIAIKISRVNECNVKVPRIWFKIVQRRDRLHNLWDPVQTEIVGTLVQKLLDFQDGSSSIEPNVSPPEGRELCDCKCPAPMKPTGHV